MCVDTVIGMSTLHRTAFLCRHLNLSGIECFHMTSRRPYWCSKQWNGGHVGAPNQFSGSWTPFLSYANAFFCSKNLHRFWSREWKHSTLYSENTSIHTAPKSGRETYPARRFAPLKKPRWNHYSHARTETLFPYAGWHSNATATGIVQT